MKSPALEVLYGKGAFQFQPPGVKISNDTSIPQIT